METHKPFPVMQPWTKEFWKATKQGKLLVQHCNDCQINIFFPKKVCPECWSENLSWIESSGKAKVYTFTTMLDMVEPKFMGDLPYVIAMVDLLEEGIRMTTRIVNCKPENVAIGMHVEVVFQDVSEDCALPMFQPVEESLRIKTTDQEETEKTVSETEMGLRLDDYQTILYEIGGKNNAV
ncbi:MAG: Zn-ribbon domain-containing OB-fold protein [Deltaproteobacteria bacterium]|nr:Zn-ribbon domain-containing OB-fold protein [Deltaproteobacteria bacterium]